MRWFGAWYDTTAVIEQTVREYIANATGGNPDALAQVAVFRLVPWEAERAPAAHGRRAGRLQQWIDAFAAGIGSSRVALILQPDLPFAMCVPRHSGLPSQLVAYASRVFDALPHRPSTSMPGRPTGRRWVRRPACWSPPASRYARGFALNATHYDGTGQEIAFGARVARALAAAHVPGRHFVINTASNGRPFTYQQYHGPNFNNAAVCPTAPHGAASRWASRRPGR